MTENGETSIDILPDEVLEKIFQWLPVFEIKKNLSTVCKRWYEVSKFSSLLRSIEFGPAVSTDAAIQVLHEARMLGSLKLVSRPDANLLLNEVSNSNLKLWNLKVMASKDARCTSIEQHPLITCLRSLKNLKHLTLKRVTIDDPAGVFNELGPAARCLVKLNLKHSLQVDTESLLDLVHGLPMLTDFRIYCHFFNWIGSVTPYTDAPVELLARKMVGLQVLKLNMHGVSGAVLKAISDLPLLRVLHLYRLALVQDDSMAHISRLKKLEKLMVTYPTNISSQCWCGLLGSPSMVTLTMIVISNSVTLDDQVLRTIAANCPALVEVGFPGCRKITNGGVEAVFASCRCLLRVNLFLTKSSIVDSFRLLPACLPDLELLIFRAFDSVRIAIPDEVKSMRNLKVQLVYRYP